MLLAAEPLSETILNRRQAAGAPPEGRGERRQFTGRYEDLSPEGQELGRAVDEYKLMHRRRIITYDELAGIIRSLNYAPIADGTDANFTDRRVVAPTQGVRSERRQFGGSYDDLTPEGPTLGRGMDEYKVRHHRRFVTYDEMLAVVRELGYVRLANPA